MKRFLTYLIIFSMLFSLEVVLPQDRAAAAQITHSGTCGENVTWSLDDT